MSSSYRGTVHQCIYYGRHVEPLAWSLDPRSSNPQTNSSLIARIPPEIRNKIYEYTLTDCTSNPPNTDKPARRPLFLSAPSRKLPSSDIAFPLLQSCKAVYLDTFKLPLLLNPFTVYRFGSLPSYDITRPRFLDLAPWQFALMQHLDVSVQQTNLESDYLAKYLDIWRAAERHAKYVVAPRFYQETRNTYPGPVTQSFTFGLLSVTPAQDGIPVTLPVKSSSYPANDTGSQPRDLFSVTRTARAMVARPLTQLTLRLSRTDWWTWEEDPAAPTVDHLGLDPAFGDGRGGENERPAHPRMMNLAAERRAGLWPNPWHQDPPPAAYSGTWGAHIAKLRDLKVLELILETYGAKKAQLDTVVDCAKTWKFPLDGGKWQLVFDPDEELFEFDLPESDMNWADEGSDRSWVIEEPTAVVRIIRFKRARVH